MKYLCFGYLDAENLSSGWRKRVRSLPHSRFLPDWGMERQSLKSSLVGQ